MLFVGDYVVGSEASVGSYVECGQGALVDQLGNVGSRQSEQIGCLLLSVMLVGDGCVIVGGDGFGG